jgi:hypothetical protein
MGATGSALRDLAGGAELGRAAVPQPMVSPKLIDDARKFDMEATRIHHLFMLRASLEQVATDPAGARAAR